jgi:arylformamidase
MRLIDLSTTYDMVHSTRQPPFPGEKNDITWFATLPHDGFWGSNIHISAHTGTHMDSPMHICKKEDVKSDNRYKGERYYMSDWPLDDLFGETVCWDIPKGEDEPIKADDFEKANKKLPILDSTKFVLVYTGWGRYMENDPCKNENYTFFRGPGLDVDGAEWLVKTKIKGYGQDTLGTQWKGRLFPQTEKEWRTGILNYPAELTHFTMLSHSIILFEHLHNLDKIAGKRVTCGFFPLPVKGTEGAPQRAVAFLDD